MTTLRTELSIRKCTGDDKISCIAGGPVWLGGLPQGVRFAAKNHCNVLQHMKDVPFIFLAERGEIVDKCLSFAFRWRGTTASELYKPEFVEKFRFSSKIL